MVKSIITLSIDSELYLLIKEKYPHKVSKLVEEYFEGMLGMDESDFETESINEIDREIKNTSEEITKLKFKLDNLNTQKLVKDEERKKESEIKRKKGEAMVDALRASGLAEKTWKKP